MTVDLPKSSVSLDECGQITIRTVFHVDAMTLPVRIAFVGFEMDRTTAILLRHLLHPPDFFWPFGLPLSIAAAGEFFDDNVLLLVSSLSYW